MSPVLALERLSQKDCEFEASLGFIGRPCLETAGTAEMTQRVKHLPYKHENYSLGPQDPCKYQMGVASYLWSQCRGGGDRGSLGQIGKLNKPNLCALDSCGKPCVNI